MLVMCAFTWIVRICPFFVLTLRVDGLVMVHAFLIFIATPPLAAGRIGADSWEGG